LKRLILPALVFSCATHAQNPPERPATQPAVPATAREAAQVDFTGYWVAVVTEDWRWRMATPSKGDFASVPMNPDAMKIADAWDPAKDEAAGEACKGYGAAAIMRRPARLHITWQDADTLRIDIDDGTQTRLLRFRGDPPANAERTWQGFSMANWERIPRGVVVGNEEPLRGRNLQPPPGDDRVTIEVTTVGLRPGYLRKNGIPYSEDTVVKEYFDVIAEPSGTPWLIVTTIVEDPKYLRTTFVTSSNFKKQRDGAGWNPTPCSAK
jgi:hypothetical protein